MIVSRLLIAALCALVAAAAAAQTETKYLPAVMNGLEVDIALASHFLLKVQATDGAVDELDGPRQDPDELADQLRRAGVSSGRVALREAAFAIYLDCAQSRSILDICRLPEGTTSRAEAISFGSLRLSVLPDGQLPAFLRDRSLIHLTAKVGSHEMAALATPSGERIECTTMGELRNCSYRLVVDRKLLAWIQFTSPTNRKDAAASTEDACLRVLRHYVRWP